MRALNMAAITASLERSFENCSLDHRHHHRNRRADQPEEEEEEELAEEVFNSRGKRRTSTISDGNNNLPNSASDTALELNSHLALPYTWEQCLDLKTGEVYYINWRTGMRATEDPRTMNSGGGGGSQHDGGGGTDLYSDDDDVDDDDDDSSCESDEEESSSEYYSPSSSSKGREYPGSHGGEKDRENVLVVAGCKSCLMYFMVPKQVEDCPKCTGQLLHFDHRPDHHNAASS